MLRYLIKAIRNPHSLIIFAAFLLFAPVFLSGMALFWGTQITQFIPWWQYAVEILKVGELPLWNSLNGMGAPLLANYQSALLYPPTWLLLGLGAFGGITWLAWGLACVLSLHITWAGIGMARLIKSLGWGFLSQLVAGLSFGLSGYLVTRSHFPSIVFAVAWLPWILLAAFHLVSEPGRLRHILWLGLGFGMLLLAGHAQTAWHIIILCVVWVLYWVWNGGQSSQRIKVIWLFSAALILGIFLSSVQLLPTMEYLIESQRASEVDYEFAVAYSFWPWRFLTIFIPNLYGSPAAGNYGGYAAYWEDALYIGLIPILLAIKAVFSRSLQDVNRRLIWFLLAVSTVSFLLALGDNTPVFPWLYHNVPSFDMFQAPTRFSIWAVFSFSLLAGLGASTWKRPKGRSLYWSRLGVAGAAAIAVGVGLALFLQQTGEDYFSDIPATYIPAFALLSFWGVLAAGLNLVAPEDDHAAHSMVWTYAVLAVISLDLLSVSWGLNPGIDISLYQRSPEYGFDSPVGNPNGKRVYISSEEERLLKFERFFSFETFDLDEDWLNIRATLLPNTNILAGIPSANNFDPLVPGRYDAWMAVLDTASPLGRQAMLTRMSVDWVEHPDPDSPNGVWFEEVASEERIRWVPCNLVVSSEHDALEMISNAHVEASQWIIHVSEEKQKDKNCDSNLTEKVEVISAMNNHMIVKVNAEHDGWLVVSDVWYPGWKVEVDGEPAEIHLADALFRSVFVPAGPHIVEFHYRPLSFYIGAALSILTWGGMLWAWNRNR